MLARVKSRCECDTVIITQVLSTLLKFWTKLCGVLFGIDPWYCGPYRTNTQGSDIFLNVLWPIWSRYFNVRHRYYQVCGIYSINDIESRLKVKNRKLVSDFICALQLMLSREQFQSYCGFCMPSCTFFHITLLFHSLVVCCLQLGEMYLCDSLNVEFLSVI